MIWTLLLACAGTDEAAPHCDAFPDEPVDVTNTGIDWEDDCGTWSVALDAWVAVSVQVTDENTACEAAHGDALDPADPAYTNMSNDLAKRTFQVYAVGATGDEPDALDVTCDDGNAWSGQFYVE